MKSLKFWYVHLYTYDLRPPLKHNYLFTKRRDKKFLWRRFFFVISSNSTLKMFSSNIFNFRGGKIYIFGRELISRIKLSTEVVANNLFCLVPQRVIYAFFKHNVCCVEQTISPIISSMHINEVIWNRFYYELYLTMRMNTLFHKFLLFIDYFIGASLFWLLRTSCKIIFACSTERNWDFSSVNRSAVIR